jgi:hypothetical protein
VVLAPMVMLYGKGEGVTVGSDRLAEGYLFALICAVVMAFTHLMVRAAIGDTGLGIAGALVAYGAAAVPLLLGGWDGQAG